MKSFYLICIYLGLAALDGAAAEIDGTWKAVFTCPAEQRPKMVSEMIFKFSVAGDKLTGHAHMANWPGDAAISDGTFDGDHFKFTAVGHLPWSGSRYGVVTASGYPKLVFTGTLSGNEMKVHLDWGSIMITGEEPGGHEYEMKATRMTEAR